MEFYQSEKVGTLRDIMGQNRIKPREPDCKLQRQWTCTLTLSAMCSIDVEVNMD